MAANGTTDREQSRQTGPDGTRADARRRRVYDAAVPLFDRFGFKKTTVGDVCEAAGISKRTFYDLFRDKLDLLHQLVTDVYNERTYEWEQALDPTLDPLGQLYAFLDLYASVPREHPFLGVLFEDFDLMRAFGQWIDELRISREDGPLFRILREGMETGQFRPMEPRAAMWVVFGLLDTVYFLIPRVMEVPGAMDDPALAQEVNRFIVHGLGAIGPEGAQR